MTEKELAQIETKLKIKLPREYRELMLARAAELTEVGCFNEDLSTYYLDPNEIISVNTRERSKDAGTAYAFPKWWQTFFLVGTNGGGDYYCLRLDNKPGVWMIGSDCGEEPTLLDESLKAYVDLRVNEYKEEAERAASRNDLFQEEIAEELEAIAGVDDPKAKGWLEARSPYPMFEYLDNLGYTMSPRKLRLFGLACCSRIPNLSADEDCRRALLLADQLVNGTAPLDEVAALRAEMKRKHLAICRGQEESPAGLWALGAARNLLQDDNDYLNDAPIDAGDAELLRVWYSASSATPGDQHQAQADLLREVLGNPFHPVAFEPRWRTAPGVDLARAIYDEQTFERMPALGQALMAAGCEDERILKHSRRTAGHVRGCWVLDLVLGLDEPQSQEEEFTWDFKWEHSRIDLGKLKRRLQEFGTDSGGDAKLNDDNAVLAFADWLEENGDKAWAKYIRVRCALDGKIPGDDYPSLYEEYLESAAAMQPGRAEFEGFYFSGYRFEIRDDDGDDMEKGLPSFVDAVSPGRGAGPAAMLIKRLDALVRYTPVRGINLEEDYAADMATILNSPGARHLRRISFYNRPAEGQAGPVIEALVKSPAVRSLERLQVAEGIRSDADALAMAGAPFERLRQLDVYWRPGVDCSARAVEELMNAAWFRQLHQLQIRFAESCCETGMLQLAGMPHLHTLACWHPGDRQILALARAGEFPAVRRLSLHGASLTGKNRAAFAQWKLPRLMELWLVESQAASADIRALAATPLFDNLRMLSLRMHGEADLDAFAASVCGPELRSLRIYGDGDLVGSFRSLAATALTRPSAFPELTTLELQYPYARKAKKDAAQFLKKLATSKLRHLTMAYCDFNDECARGAGDHADVLQFERLVLDQAILSARAAEKIMRSSNLQHLVELRIEPYDSSGHAALGKVVTLLEDQSVLPKLVGGWFDTSGVPEKTIERIKAKRPGVHIYQR